MAYSGKFVPTNPEKYVGDPNNIIFRSNWERVLMKYLDSKKNVISWFSEELPIPYVSPLDNRQHRYFPDFGAEVIMKDGSRKKILIEVKPFSQTQKPKPPAGAVQNGKIRRNSRFAKELKTYMVNMAKWKAAQALCEQQGWEFQIMTERELGIK